VIASSPSELVVFRRPLRMWWAVSVVLGGVVQAPSAAAQVPSGPEGPRTGQLPAGQPSPVVRTVEPISTNATATARPGTPLGRLASPRLRVLADSARHPWIRWPVFRDVAEDVRRAYAVTEGAPLWLSGRVPSPAAIALLAELRRARERGLEPDDYDADTLATRVPWVRFAPPDSLDARAAEWDLALSIAAARYALAVHRGRVNPRRLFALLRFPRDTARGTDFLLAVRSTTNPSAFLDQLEPRFREYRLLRAALPRLRALAADTTLPPLPVFPRRIKPGEAWVGMPSLRARLVAYGDLDPAWVTPGDTSTAYDSTLVAAVKRYQRGQGFAEDGVIGDSTRARLQRPLAEQVRQIELTMERWRWLPKLFTTPPIVVNLASFRLTAYRGMSDDVDSVLSMRVVVGKSVDHSTPLLADTMTSVVFRPYWDVPRSIMEKEIRPQALRSPAWFVKEGYELVSGSTVLPPTPEHLARIARGGVRVRQVPGKGNALGDMKFLLPNEKDIYLHDTPSRSLFQRARRDFSHGCVRLEQPLALALHVLRDMPEWTEEKIAEALMKKTPTSVRLRTPVPVYLYYGTAVALDDGSLAFFADLYGHDRTLDALLKQGYPY
jgi:murein L,D-transpeptidase YcbB/YkuD